MQPLEMKHRRDAKGYITAPEEFLLGALDMVEAGVPPSKAVALGASGIEVADIQRLLGVPHLRMLDALPYDQLRRLLADYAV